MVILFPTFRVGPDIGGQIEAAWRWKLYKSEARTAWPDSNPGTKNLGRNHLEEQGFSAFLSILKMISVEEPPRGLE